MFSRRVKLFTLFGFDVKVDASWLLLAVLVTWTLAEGVLPNLRPGLRPETYWWMAAAGAVGLFASIVFHEMAHSLVARRHGIVIRGITLFIFGGVAEMESEPASARSELFMAVAGPIASLALAVLLFVLTGLVRGAAPDAVTGVLWYLAIINGVLALFNLVPAFPLDGGRVLRAALWAWRGDILWATRMASGGGNLFGTVLIMLGLIDVVRGDFVNGMWRFLLGMFLRSAAEQSYQQIVAQRALSGTTVAQAMTRNPVALSPDLTIGEFIDDYVYRHHHRTFPVVRQHRLIGYVGTQQAVMIDRASWARTPVEQVMIACSTDDMVSPEVDALVALGQMRRTGRTRLYVVRAGRLVGILSLRDMLELLSTKLELGRDPISAAGHQGAGQGQNPARSALGNPSRHHPRCDMLAVTPRSRRPD